MGRNGRYRWYHPRRWLEVLMLRRHVSSTGRVLNAFHVVAGARGRLIMSEDYTSLSAAHLTASGWTDKALGNSNSEAADSCPNYTLIDAPGRSGEKCLQMTIAPSDWVLTTDQSSNRERCELIRDPLPGEGIIGTNYWYQYSIWIPADYGYTHDVGVFEIVGQFHDSVGSGGFQPVTSLHMRSTGPSDMGIRFRYGCLNSYQGIPADIEQLLDISITREQWHDIIYHFRWSTGSDGYLDPYVDGVRYPRINGRNMYNASPNYFRLGIYRGTGIGTTDTINLMRYSSATSQAALAF